MIDCEICRNYKACKSENKDKVDKCFFVYPTEEYLAKDTKDYARGYEQGKKDAFLEIAYSDYVIKEPFEKLAYEKGIADERKRIIEELEELRDRFDKNDFGIRGVLEKAIEIVKGIRE